MPPNPKRPPHSEPLSDDQVLRVDDPRPQRVAQLPSSPSARRPVKRVEEHIQTSIFDTEADQEMQAEYGVQGTEYKPAFLYVERGPGAGQLLEVKQGSVVIGRASVSDLRLQHPSISRRHTQIKRVGEQFFVKDLGSQNGTFVNKQRIATEVEVKPGDSIALGNALLRLRGPLSKGEKLPSVSSSQPMLAPDDTQPSSVSGVTQRLQAHAPAASSGAKSSDARGGTDKARVTTSLVQRPVAPKAPSSTALKVAVFAGAVGFSLAGVLAFALVRAMNPEKPAPTTVAASSATPRTDDKSKLIDEAIKRKMAEAPPDTKGAEIESAEIKSAEIKSAEIKSAEIKSTVEAPAVDAAAPVAAKAVGPSKDPVAKPAAKAPVVTAAPRVAAATKKPAAKTEEDDDEEDETAAPAAAGGAKRAQILAAYEKGNAEGSLESAKKAGDRELADKLSRFIAAYDAAKDAVFTHNGTAAITNFQKALALDEQLSSGWGKYGGEIRRQLSDLYVLVGMKFASTGDDAKAKTAFEAALKHEPNNKSAKSQLAKLSSGGDEDEAPKPAKKKASAIDDAFGD